VIIVDKIEHSPRLAVTRDDFGDLSKCPQPQQRPLFEALKARIDAKK
jgi:hypothetical protein